MLEAVFQWPWSVGFVFFLPTVKLVCNSTTFVAPVVISNKVSHLFLFYIAQNLSNDTVIALFADNVSTLTTAHKKEDAVAAAHSEVTRVYEWSWTLKLNLNADKSECCPFSTWSNDSMWCPSLTIGGHQIRVNDTPWLFGVILDCSLSFNAHVKHIKQSLSSRFQAITVTAHASWGWQKPSWRTAFHALVCSKLDYSAPAWQPWLSNTNSLDHIQNQALRLITGQLVSTPLKSLRLESGIQSYYTESKRMIVWAREKWLRTAADHPKQLALQNNIPQRIATQSSFRCKATELSTILPEELSHRQVTNLFPSPPWLPSSFCTNQISSQCSS